MTDIDFDELDRAVHSLMQQHTTKESPGSTEVTSQPSQDSNTSQPVSAQSVSDTRHVEPSTTLRPATLEPSHLAVSPEQSVPTSVNTPSLATRRSTGRFMDVVHPSSDMMSNHPIQSRTSRVGISLQPTVVSEVKQSTAETIEPTGIEELQAMTTQEDPVLTMKDMESVEQKTPELSLESRMQDELNAAQQPPLQSPFVQGAVVDKRPLGGTNISDATAGEFAEADIPQTVPVLDNSEDPAEQDDVWGGTESEDQLIAEPLVPELDSELIALESSDPSDLENIPSFDSQQAEAKKTSVDEKSAPSAMSSFPPEKAIVATTPVLGDIPQQYTADLDSEPEPAPMYDAASQSPELTHKEKKKSGWLTVMFIMALLILGGAGGAAAWYLFL